MFKVSYASSAPVTNPQQQGQKPQRRTSTASSTASTSSSSSSQQQQQRNRRPSASSNNSSSLVSSITPTPGETSLASLTSSQAVSNQEEGDYNRRGTSISSSSRRGSAANSVDREHKRMYQPVLQQPARADSTTTTKTITATSTSSSFPLTQQHKTARHVLPSRSGGEHDESSVLLPVLSSCASSSSTPHERVAAFVYKRSVFLRVVIAAGMHRANRVADNFCKTCTERRQRQRLFRRWWEQMLSQRADNFMALRRTRTRAELFGFWRKQARLSQLSRGFDEEVEALSSNHNNTRANRRLLLRHFEKWKQRYLVERRRPLLRACFQRWREQEAAHYMLGRLVGSLREQCWGRWVAKHQRRSQIHFSEQVRRRVVLWKALTMWREAFYFRLRAQAEANVRATFVMRQCFCRWRARRAAVLARRRRLLDEDSNVSWFAVGGNNDDSSIL